MGAEPARGGTAAADRPPDQAVHVGAAEPLVTGLGRALGGALLFSLPVLMTMEVWELGHTVPRYRLALLVLVTVALVIGLARSFGAVRGRRAWSGYLTDAGIAFVVATGAAAVVLTALGVIRPFESWRDAISVVAIETLPAAVGASFARSQLGRGSRRTEASGYGHELFLMAAGAAVFSANIAPTEEVLLLGSRVGPGHTIALVLLSLVLMHGFVYRVGFKGQEAGTSGPLGSFLALTVVGYVLAVAVSAYLLWTFGRFDGVGAGTVVAQAVVLGLPASLGAAAARLVL